MVARAVHVVRAPAPATLDELTHPQRSRTSIPPCPRTPAPRTLSGGGGSIVLSRGMRSVLTRWLRRSGPAPSSCTALEGEFAMGRASIRQRGNVLHTLPAPESSHLERIQRLRPPQSKDPAQRTRGLPRPRSVIFRMLREELWTMRRQSEMRRRRYHAVHSPPARAESCSKTAVASSSPGATSSKPHRHGGCAGAHPRAAPPSYRERRETQARGPRICCAASSLIAVGTTMPRRNPLNARGYPSRSAGGLRCGRLGGADPPPRAEENPATPRAAAACRAWRSRSVDARDRGRSPGGATSAPPYSNDDPAHTDADGARRLPRHRLARTTRTTRSVRPRWEALRINGMAQGCHVIVSVRGVDGLVDAPAYRPPDIGDRRRSGESEVYAREPRSSWRIRGGRGSALRCL
ncbi:hypothetical protein DFH09DRAFT_1319357 [Mycena vulgaris]|nr:hypothetical protein DFH09DRAFT_1319357 [Mycena vulgaris]